MVNSKSEEEEDENEWDGEGGRVWDLEGLSVLLPIVDCYIICIVLRERKRERERERQRDGFESKVWKGLDWYFL